MGAAVISTENTVVTMAMIQNVFNTLPIAYYLGRNIKVDLTDTNESYFSLSEDKINIGARHIITSWDRLDPSLRPNFNLEQIIRGLLYHEISHALLTPLDIYTYAPTSKKNRTIINIFEDERIETINARKFMGVNFKKMVVILNNFTGEEPKSAMSAFFHVVRYRQGKKIYVDKVKKIIHKYKEINTTYTKKEDEHASYWHDPRITACENYVQEVIDLYNLIAKDYPEDESDLEKYGDDSYSPLDEMSDDEKKELAEELSKALKEAGNKDEESGGSGDSEESGDSDGSTITIGIEDPNGDESEGNSGSNSPFEIIIGGGTGSEEMDEDLPEGLKKLLDLAQRISDDTNQEDEDKSINTAEELEDIVEKSIDIYNDPVLTAKLNTIIDLKTKQKNKSGSAICSYSGRLDPRSVALRDDYKWWVASNRLGNIKKYSKIHFNLIIDNSGSFSKNTDKMNTFIQCLNRINNSDFSFDVITINDKIVEWENTHRYFYCKGGNTVPDSLQRILAKHQKRNALTYNIVLFDGDAHSDDRYTRKYNESSDNLRFFNTRNTIIISDDDNKKYFDKCITSASIVYTKNYCEEFIDQIINLLSKIA